MTFKKTLNTLILATLIIAPSITALSHNAIADERSDAIQAISTHFRTVPTMTGEFVQFGPKGEQTGGTFYIQRPGKMRLDYEEPSPLLLISNGRMLSVSNAKLKTNNYYPLRKTPLSLLLDDKINIDDNSIREVSTENGVTTVVMGDKNIFGDSQITLLFDKDSQDLRQWTIKDAQGKETSVLILNVKKNIKIPKKLFKVGKKAVR